ncbi:ABC1 kinase family protein [Paraclostridium sordellii]|uniref:Ubiquinone biosynthesis protein n=1 Tax=Paraclostridium sordellii TaxID=1505 RepID=A0A0C7Q0L1_PARSO|nr:AarF/UbiB family protein [Paeniclostridium sordellii]CEO14265.1 ubiquinone biosynthesis protein [[Clostridium] sordellii] [Paeniclostridium sordellii]CEP89499.1 ubiquinone biosynthesis protein [[Clostridium] sordellii] [Paeniclostridium sordellii]CEP98032.1 ubiquinone biosynthesis protein [[Clostridium] sordellii] [Paeniclostridium sordellii]CEQ01423.1 ubiquinone biosynthesis protein [[Clostridium] sordellii] [Paeniclostridium sordellii]CEQ05187.1 ubiquinone biosynthesis protein [[Clostridi
MKVSYRHLKRYKEIVQILMKYGFSIVVEKLNIEGVAYKIPITNPPAEIKNMSTGERLRKACEELGPTYVKLGQILSTRKDLLDQNIIDELAKLRDNVEVFDTDIAINMIEEELNSKLENIFLKFNKEPIAAASLGQVYEATLKSGETVIVKVQRPNVENTIKSDVEILKTIAGAVKDFNKDLNVDIQGIIEDFETQLLRELDYNFEAINGLKFQNIFANTQEVYIPKVYMEYTTKKVLVLEKIVGVKLSDIEKMKELGWDTEKISEIGINSIFKQIFEYGFFHADPHPGNIFVINESCIAYIDFGMIGIIDKKTLNILNSITLAAVDRNIDRIIYLMMELDLISYDTNLNGLRQDLLYLMHYYYDVPIDKLNLGDILNEVFRFCRTYKIAMPPQLVLLVKSLITLEGTARELNPNFSITIAGKSFMRYYYLNRFNPQNLVKESKQSAQEAIADMKVIPKQLKGILRNIERNNIKIHIEDVKFAKLEKTITDLATKLSLSLVLAALLVGSSLIIASPNVNSSLWVKILAFSGFIVSFLVGILLVIKIVRSEYIKK